MNSDRKQCNVVQGHITFTGVHETLAQFCCSRSIFSLSYEDNVAETSQLICLTIQWKWSIYFCLQQYSEKENTNWINEMIKIEICQWLCKWYSIVRVLFGTSATVKFVIIGKWEIKINTIDKHLFNAIRKKWKFSKI